MTRSATAHPQTCVPISPLVHLRGAATAYVRIAVFAALLLGTRSHTLAGGGPENVFLVVNPNDDDSLTIANHYAALRQIPAVNIFYLDWSGSPEKTTIDQFRQQILIPILTQIQGRRLIEQIDYIVYSSGFPYAVDFSSDLDSEQKFTVASLTGLTYLYQFTLHGGGIYAAANSNRYFRVQGPSHGFRNRHRWGSNGQPTAGVAPQYYLSTMLGYTAGRGNTVAEVIQYLERSVGADGSRRRGTIYFVQNDDIRSQARHETFPAAAAELRRMGIAAEIVDGIVPAGRSDVMGAMLGCASFHWANANSRILPGAICDHFTSFGGILSASGSQTPLTEFLRHGAAGACGTVVEPYAIPAKFPHAWIHVHYARGCNLAEAFYQSVAAPYQLLIVGDPLCEPWANRPTLTVSELSDGAEVTGVVKLRPTSISGPPLARLQLYRDGRLAAESPAGGEIELDTSTISDRYHELRVVGIGREPIETQARLILPVIVNNRGRTISCQVEPAGSVAIGQRIVVTARSPASESIRVYHNRRLLGVVKGEQGQVLVDPEQLGAGPVRLTVVGVGDSAGNHVFARPLDIEVKAHAVVGSPPGAAR